MPTPASGVLDTAFCRSVKPGPKRQRFVDPKLKNFELNVQPSGAKSFVLDYWFRGRHFTETLGSWLPQDGGNLREMRSRAVEFLKAVARGDDPRQTMQSRANGGQRFVEDVFEAYLASLDRPGPTGKRVKVKTVKNRCGVWNTHLKALWSGTLIGNLSREDMDAALLSILEKGQTVAPGPRQKSMHATALNARKLIIQFVKWARREKCFPQDPFLDGELMALAASGLITRTLDDREIAVLWEACARLEKAGWSFAALPRILLLSGQRRGEVLDMPLSEVAPDFATWSVGSARGGTKNGAAHVLPLAPLALAEMKAQMGRARLAHLMAAKVGQAKHQRRAQAGGPVVDVLFPIYSSTVKLRLDAECAEVASEWGVEPPAPWVLHDLRRTFATRLGDLGVEPWLYECLLNHRSRSDATRGISGRYQTAAFIRQKLAALTAYEAEIARVVALDWRANRRLAA